MTSTVELERGRLQYYLETQEKMEAAYADTLPALRKHFPAVRYLRKRNAKALRQLNETERKLNLPLSRVKDYRLIVG